MASALQRAAPRLAQTLRVSGFRPILPQSPVGRMIQFQLQQPRRAFSTNWPNRPVEPVSEAQASTPAGRLPRPYYHDYSWWQNPEHQTETVKNFQREIRHRRWIRVLMAVLPAYWYLSWLYGRINAKARGLSVDMEGGYLGSIIDLPPIKWFAGSWLGQQLSVVSRRRLNNGWKLAAADVDTVELFWLEVARLRRNPEQLDAVLREAFRLQIRSREYTRLTREALGLEPGKFLKRNYNLRQRRATHEQFMYERGLSAEDRVRYLTVEARLAEQRVAQRKQYIEEFQKAGYPGSKGLEAAPSPVGVELRFGLPRVVV